MSGIAASRLSEERKSWRKDHPMFFTAKPKSNDDGSVNMFVWDCKIPGKDGTLWAGGLFPLTLSFGTHYPEQPPRAAFERGFKHPNVFDDGSVCLSIIGKAWRPSVSVKQILLGIQELLSDPNKTDPASWDVNDIYIKNPRRYELMVREQVERYSAARE